MRVLLSVTAAVAALGAGVTVGAALLPRPSRAVRYLAAGVACLVAGLVIAGAVLAQ